MPSTKKQQDTEEVVFLAVRIPKSMKRDLLQFALDKDSSIQAIIRSSIETVLAEQPPTQTKRR